MRNKARNWWMWAHHRPRVLINLAGILLVIGLTVSTFAYLAVKPIDVLSSWDVGLTNVKEYKTIDGKRMAVYNPGSSLLFTSTSVKVADANGVTNRMIVCRPTSTLPEQEIQLDTMPAVRPPGLSPARDNAITVPDVTQFRDLPRICKLVIDIGYDDVILWRDYSEHAETEWFLVEEESLSVSEAKQQIKILQEKLAKLEAIIAESSNVDVAQSTPSTPAPVEQQPDISTAQPTNEVAVTEDTAPEEQPQPVRVNPLVSIVNGITGAVGGILNAVGL